MASAVNLSPISPMSLVTFCFRTCWVLQPSSYRYLRDAIFLCQTFPGVTPLAQESGIPTDSTCPSSCAWWFLRGCNHSGWRLLPCRSTTCQSTEIMVISITILLIGVSSSQSFRNHWVVTNDTFSWLLFLVLCFKINLQFWQENSLLTRFRENFTATGLK